MPLGAGERILRGGRREGTGEDRASRRSEGRRRERRRGCAPAGSRSPDRPPSSRCRDAGCLTQVPAAAPTVRAPAALGAEGGELRWRDARPAPASSSARHRARAALVRCGGSPGAPRSGLAVRAAAAASCLPGATSEPQAEQPRVARDPQPEAQRLQPGELRARPPQASALCDAARGDRQAICEPGLVCSPGP